MIFKSRFLLLEPFDILKLSYKAVVKVVVFLRLGMKVEGLGPEDSYI